MSMLKFLILPLLLLCACSSQRKLSTVGLRNPSSLGTENEEVSALRAKFATRQDFAKGCPQEWTQILRQVALEKVKLPSCPESFLQSEPLTVNELKIEERGLVEAIYSSHCESLVRGQLEDQLKNFLDSYDSSGPIGRLLQEKTRAPAQEKDQRVQQLEALRDGLKELSNLGLPLEKWILANGEYLLAERDLRFLDSVIAGKCQLVGVDFASASGNFKAIEDLKNILSDKAQIGALNSVLQGLQKLIDTMVSEYFKK